MLLCVDIGNTNVVFGVTDKDQILHHWRIRTDRDITLDELGIMVGNLFQSAGMRTDDIKNVIISCVVPPVLRTFEDFSQQFFNIRPMVVGPELLPYMPILYDNPREVGVDRIVNAVGAYEKYSTGLVVVDFGTATTFDYISKQGAYMGGAIAPGVLTSSEALSEKAAKLPRVDLLTRPKSAIARDTVNSMNVGIVYGHAGLVDGIVNRIKKEVGHDLMVVATGGLAPLISEVSETIDHVEKFLTLHGLMVIFRKNG
jgi:type III pantothenate kinase